MVDGLLEVVFGEGDGLLDSVELGSEIIKVVLECAELDADLHIIV